MNKLDTTLHNAKLERKVKNNEKNNEYLFETYILIQNI